MILIGIYLITNYMDKLYVKKIYSLSPDEYKYIPLDFAILHYGKYLHNAQYFKYIKSFEEWLDTEI